VEVFLSRRHGDPGIDKIDHTKNALNNNNASAFFGETDLGHFFSNLHENLG
jgi:hypothetical protein